MLVSVCPPIGEALVPSTNGLIIADSLGIVDSTYNIQSYMERTIQQVGGATNFESIITYPNTITQIPNTITQIPNSYKYN